MGIFATIFGSGKVIEKGLELIDDAWETDEEAREGKANAKIKLMTAYAPFKIAQRYLAVMFTATYLICFFIVLIRTLLEMGETEGVLAVMESFEMSWIMSTIVLFYFGGGLVESIRGTNK